MVNLICQKLLIVSLSNIKLRAVDGSPGPIGNPDTSYLIYLISTKISTNGFDFDGLQESISLSFSCPKLIFLFLDLLGMPLPQILRG